MVCELQRLDTVYMVLITSWALHHSSCFNNGCYGTILRP